MSKKRNPSNPVDIKRLSAVAMLCALAFVSVAVIRIPVIPSAPFLRYEPKDCILAITAFVYGPVTALLGTVTVSLIEMLTISETGLIGFFMNITSTLLFILPASLLYKKNKNLKTAVTGLIGGIILMAGGMMLWNYIVTPFYMGTPRADVVKSLIPVFLPFNLFKGSLNAVLTVLLYKRTASLLRKAGAAGPQQGGQDAPGRKRGILITVISCVLVASLILLLLALQGKL